MVPARQREDDRSAELGFGAHLAFGSLAGYAAFVVLAAFGEWVLAVDSLATGVLVLPLVTYLLQLLQLTAAGDHRRRARRQRV